MRLLCALVCVALAALAGCGGDEMPTPEETTAVRDLPKARPGEAGGQADADVARPLLDESRAEAGIQKALEFASENRIPGEDLVRLMDLHKKQSKHRFGIDISHHQLDVDWEMVAAAGVHFAYIKASEGIDWQDPEFAENWSASAEAGVKRGAYHMFRPEDSAEDQVRNFIVTLELAGELDGMLPPVLDVEQVHTVDSVSRDVLHQRITDWLKAVEKELGVRPVVYTNPKFWQGYLSDDHELTNFPLWISEYNLEATEPATTGAWQSYALWQFSRYGLVPGVKTTVDLNRAHASFPDEK